MQLYFILCFMFFPAVQEHTASHSSHQLALHDDAKMNLKSKSLLPPLPPIKASIRTNTSHMHTDRPEEWSVKEQAAELKMQHHFAKCQPIKIQEDDHEIQSTVASQQIVHSPYQSLDFQPLQYQLPKLQEDSHQPRHQPRHQHQNYEFSKASIALQHGIFLRNRMN